MKQVALPGLSVPASARGRDRQATGASAERVFERAHEACVRAGMADSLVRLDAGARAASGGRVTFRPSACLDYGATLLPSERAVWLEIKSCATPRWRLSDVRPEQAQALDQRRGLRLVVIVRGTVLYPQDWSWLGPRWRAWHHATQSGARAPAGLASLDLSALPGDWRVLPGTHYLERFL